MSYKLITYSIYKLVESYSDQDPITQRNSSGSRIDYVLFWFAVKRRIF